MDESGVDKAVVEERVRIKPLLKQCERSLDLLLDALENGTLVPTRVPEQGAKALDDLRRELGE